MENTISRGRIGSHNTITVHSTVYMYVSKESKQVSHYAIYFMQVNDPDQNKFWYKLGQEAGLDIVDDEEEEEEKMEKEEEDKEVACIFKQSKQHHEQILRGTCVEGVERNKNTCTDCVLVNVKGVKSTCIQSK